MLHETAALHRVGELDGVAGYELAAEDYGRVWDLYEEDARYFPIRLQ